MSDPTLPCLVCGRALSVPFPAADVASIPLPVHGDLPDGPEVRNIAGRVIRGGRFVRCPGSGALIPVIRRLPCSSPREDPSP